MLSRAARKAIFYQPHDTVFAPHKVEENSGGGGCADIGRDNINIIAQNLLNHVVVVDGNTGVHSPPPHTINSSSNADDELF